MSTFSKNILKMLRKLQEIMEDSIIGAGDYIVLGLMLLISAAIGVYTACTGGRQRTSEEYLLGNRQMNFFTVGLSIMISFASAIGILAFPTEIYLFGTTYWWTTLSIPH